MAQSAIDLLISAVHDVTTSRYLTCIAFTVILYDWTLLLGDEVDLVRNSRLSLGKMLYYFIRICTQAGIGLMLYHMSDLRRELSSSTFDPNDPSHSCIAFTWAWPLILVASVLASYWLLLLRLVALYRSNRVVVWLLYGGFFSSYLISLALQIRAQMTFSKTIYYNSEIGMCATPGTGQIIARVFYAPFLFEIFLVCITAFRAWEDYRRHPDGSNTPLFYVLYRDGAIFFFVIAGFRLWNIWIFQMQPMTQTYLGICAMWAAITVLTTRIYLNLCQAIRGETTDDERRVMITFAKTHTAHQQAHILSDHFIISDPDQFPASFTSGSTDTQV